MQTRRKEHLPKQKKTSPVTTNPLIKIMKYDFFGEEWLGNCGACGLNLFAPTKGEYLLQYSRHTHSKNCLGGY
jgi:hypothetical protein